MKPWKEIFEHKKGNEISLIGGFLCMTIIDCPSGNPDGRMTLQSLQILIIYGETMTQTWKTGPRKLRLPFILFLALILASCASTGSQEKQDKQDKKLEASLKLAIDGFNSSFRWEDYTGAETFVPKDKKEQFWAEVDKFKGKIRITDFNLREVELKDKSTSADAILYFQFWRLESPTLQTVTFTQKWRYTEKDKHWKLSDSGFGVITKSRAGF
jgi:hypothetical protein